MIRAIFLFISIAFLSCSDDDSSVFNIAKDNIVGTWDITQARQEIRGDTVSTTTQELEITFNSDGTGTQELLGLDNAFDWYYQYNPEKVIINSAQSSFLIARAQVFTVIENSFNKQIWTSEQQGNALVLFSFRWEMTKR